MELGKSCNQAGHAAFHPDDTYAHPIAEKFAMAVGYDHEGKNVMPNSPMSGPHSPSGAPEWQEGDR
jgi:hypothetical protein